MARNIGGHDFERKQLRQESLTEEYGTLGDMDAAYVRLPSIQARLYKVSIVFIDATPILVREGACQPKLKRRCTWRRVLTGCWRTVRSLLRIIG